MIIKKEFAPLVADLFRMTSAGKAQIEILKTLTREYLGESQVTITCWTCPGSINNIYRRLVNELQGATTEQDDNTNVTTGSPDPIPNTKQNKKRSNSRSGSSDL